MEYIREQEKVIARTEDGRDIGEITFPFTDRGYYNINHTYVQPAFENQGIGSRLVQEAAEVIRQSGDQAIATCPFAVAWFERHPAEADILL